MTGKESGPEWQGEDSFGPGWGNQTTHEPQAADAPVAGEDFGAGASAGNLTQGGFGASPGGSEFAIRDAAWHDDVEKIRAQMEVRGSDGGHVGMVDCLRGEHIVLAKSDVMAGGAHHAISAGRGAEGGGKGPLSTPPHEAMTRTEQ